MAHQLKTWPKVIAVLVVVAGGYYGLREYERRMIYSPESAIVDTPEKIGLSFENIEFTAADGVDLHGWFVPAEPDTTASTNAACPVLLFFHESSGNISHNLDRIRVFHDLGLDVLIFDYRGFGQSIGQPTERGLSLDALAAYFHLVAARHVPPARIVLYGDSLGAAVAIDLAARVNAAGLITEAAFTSTADMAKRRLPGLPWENLMFDKYDSVAKIRRVRMPLLLLHSREDEVVPFRHSQRLYSTAGEPKELVELHGTHDEGLVNSFDIYTEKVAEFVHRLVPEPHAEAAAAVIPSSTAAGEQSTR